MGTEGVAASRRLSRMVRAAGSLGDLPAGQSALTAPSAPRRRDTLIGARPGGVGYAHPILYLRLDPDRWGHLRA